MALFNPGSGTGGPRARAQRLEMLLGILGFFTFMALVQTVVFEVRGDPAGSPPPSSRSSSSRCGSSGAPGATPASRVNRASEHHQRRRKGRGGVGGHGLACPARAGPGQPRTRARVSRWRPSCSTSPPPPPPAWPRGAPRVVGVVAPFLTRWFFATSSAASRRACATTGTTCCSSTSRTSTFDRAHAPDPEHALEASRRHHRAQRPHGRRRADPHRAAAAARGDRGQPALGAWP